MSKEALKLALEALEKLWNIIDDIDTYGDMAKGDEKLYRALVERRQRTRFEETGISTDGHELTGGAITAIKEALAQPEQEPVAYFNPQKGGFYWAKPTTICAPHTVNVVSMPLYTTPPQRKPLTDEQIRQVMRSLGWTGEGPSDIEFAQAIEAAHGIAHMG